MRTALVVDDSMLIRYTVCRFLQERGFVVQSAANGRDALDQLRRLPPNIIITDLQMPKMNGPELIRELKAHPETASIPVVILAAKRTATDPQMQAPAERVIYKDIDMEAQLANALAALA